MAWLLRSNSLDWRFDFKLIAEPACMPYKEKMKYRDQYGFIPNGMHSGGHEVENRFWPNSARFNKEVTLIPRLLGVCSFHLIPGAWRDVIERFEPDVHQFKHIPLFRKDGSPLDEEFFALNIRQVYHEAADRDRSTAPTKEYPGQGSVFVKANNLYNGKIYFKKSALGEFQLWHPQEVLGYNIAMSDNLYSAIAGLGGIGTVDALQIEEI